jgi:hypothetical protein
MNHKSWQIVLITLLTLLALSVVVVVASGRGCSKRARAAG